MTPLRFTPEEMNTAFGFNPVNETKFDVLLLEDDAEFQADLKNRIFIVVKRDSAFGSFGMSQDDFEKCLFMVGEEIVKEMNDDKIAVITHVYDHLGEIRLYFVDDTIGFADDRFAEGISERGYTINSHMIARTGCDCLLFGTPYNDGDSKGIYFEFKFQK